MISTMKKAAPFASQNFTGPLHLMIALIHKGEINIHEVGIRELFKQFLLWEDSSLDEGAEFINDSSLLIWLKSKSLLPIHEQLSEENEGELPFWEMIPELIDYCRFKEAGKLLVEKESEQSHFFYRGEGEAPEPKKVLGIDHLSLSDFASLFKQLLAKSSTEKRMISPEQWKISDAIAAIQGMLLQVERIGLEVLFSADKCREEMIIAFLGILELMKRGAIRLIRVQETGSVYIERGGVNG